MAKKTETLASIAKQLRIPARTLQDCFNRGCPRGPVDAISEWRRMDYWFERISRAHEAALRKSFKPMKLMKAKIVGDSPSFVKLLKEITSLDRKLMSLRKDLESRRLKVALQ